MPDSILERSDAVMGEKEEKLWSAGRGSESSGSEGVGEEVVSWLCMFSICPVFLRRRSSCLRCFFSLYSSGVYRGAE